MTILRQASSVLFSIAIVMCSLRATATPICYANCLLVRSGTYTSFELNRTARALDAKYILVVDLGEVRGLTAAAVEDKCANLAAGDRSGPHFTVWDDRIELKVAGRYSEDTRSRAITDLREKPVCEH